MVALKPTFIIFDVVYLAFVALVLFFRQPRAGIAWLARTGLSLLGFLLPWILLYSPYYWAGIFSPVPFLQVSDAGPMDSLEFFSFTTLPFGSSMFAYSFLVLVVCVLTLFAWSAARSKRALLLLAASAAALACYIMIVVGLGSPALRAWRDPSILPSPILIGA